MRRALWRRLVITALLLLTACQAIDAANLDVYYVGELSQPLQAISLPVGDDTPENIVNAVLSTPVNANLRTAFRNTECKGVTLDGTDAKVSLSLGYLNITGLERTLANACLVLTLTGLPQIDSVVIEVDGREETGRLTANDFLLGDTITPVVAEFEIFYIDAAQQELFFERRRFVVREGDSIERCLFDELMKTDPESGLIPIMPPKTRLLASELSEGTLTLSLSYDFVEGAPEDERVAQLYISGLVSAFFAVEGVERLEIQVQMPQSQSQQFERLTEYGGNELPEYLTPDILTW